MQKLKFPFDDFPIVYGIELRKYFIKHVERIPGKKDFYKVLKPVHCFKKTIRYHTESRTPVVIVNLIIPEDAVIFATPEVFDCYGRSRKMRASKAFIHSQYLLKTEKEGAPKVVSTSFAFYENFKYRTGKVVEPKNPFSWHRAECDSGIHFFLNVKDAISY